VSEVAVAMTLPRTALDVIRSLEPVGLAEVMQTAELIERSDRKYLVSGGQLEKLMYEIAPTTRVLEIDGLRSFQYETVCFDTPELDTYRMAAKGRPERVKVRTRSYMDSGLCHLEVKRKNRVGVTVKYRTPHRADERERLTSRDLAFISEIAPIGLARDRLEPTLTVRYVRTTLVGPEPSSRVTIDTELEAVDRTGHQATLGDVVVVETKSLGRATPVDRLLWRRHLRPMKMSKYCTLMAVLDPTLPANKWNRTLRNHFDWRRG